MYSRTSMRIAKSSCLPKIFIMLDRRPSLGDAHDYAVNVRGTINNILLAPTCICNLDQTFSAPLSQGKLANRKQLAGDFFPNPGRVWDENDIIVTNFHCLS